MRETNIIRRRVHDGTTRFTVLPHSRADSNPRDLTFGKPAKRVCRCVHTRECSPCAYVRAYTVRYSE